MNKYYICQYFKTVCSNINFLNVMLELLEWIPIIWHVILHFRYVLSAYFVVITTRMLW